MIAESHNYAKTHNRNSTDVDNYKSAPHLRQRRYPVFVKTTVHCPRCSLPASVKHGKRKGIQHYLCRACGKQFDDPSVEPSRGYPRPPPCKHCESTRTRRSGIDHKLGNQRYHCRSCDRIFFQPLIWYYLTTELDALADAVIIEASRITAALHAAGALTLQHAASSTSELQRDLTTGLAIELYDMALGNSAHAAVEDALLHAIVLVNRGRGLLHHGAVRHRGSARKQRTADLQTDKSSLAPARVLVAYARYAAPPQIDLTPRITTNRREAVSSACSGPVTTNAEIRKSTSP